MVPSEKTMNQLLANGGTALLRWMQANKTSVTGALNVG